MEELLVFLAVCFFVQGSHAIDEAEVFDSITRQHLNMFNKLKNESESAKYANELKLLVEVIETALEVNSTNQQSDILSVSLGQLPLEFNNWITRKVEEAGYDYFIQNNIQFYLYLLKDHAEHEADLQKAVSFLENILSETNLEEKKKNFLGLNETCSDEFQKFLLNQHLKSKVALYHELLNEKDIKFANEIEELKARTEAALADNISISEKRKVLNDLLFVRSDRLGRFMYYKNSEYLGRSKAD